MRAPLSWLKEFAPFPDDRALLGETLDDLGLVVEAVEEVGTGLDDVVVAKVREIAAIPGADRIRRVVVDTGGSSVEVVCGATNFEPGDLVPFAPAGAVLPGGVKLAKRTVRGVLSEGMLCSGRELRLSDDGAGLLVLTGVENVSPGQPLVDALGIEPDLVFDITVEGNRPDAWCIAGIARHLAARLRLPLQEPVTPSLEELGPPVSSLASVVVVDDDLCPRFTVRALTNVTVGPSAPWIARRLTLAGMRPINNVVDASNYVMLETGQPTHPYDLDRLGGSGLRVRRARPGERVVTLDGVERRLGVDRQGTEVADCVICDGNDRPVGIAGVMGGASSEISESTTRVLLEAAYFTPMAIARTAKRLGMRTEASARFERGVDPWGIDWAVKRFCHLVGSQDPAIALAPGMLDERGAVPQPFELEVPVERVNALLGTSFDAKGISELIEPLGFGVHPARSADAETLSVTVPTNRPDVRRGRAGIADIAEEVARTHGYSRIARRQPAWPQPGRLTSYQRDRRRVREVMVGLGALEVWTPSLVATGDSRQVGIQTPPVAVTNPLSSDDSALRQSLMPGLLRALAYNVERRQGELRLFEIGVVFTRPEAATTELGVPARVERSGPGGAHRSALPVEREFLGVLFAQDADDARTAVVAWRCLAEELRLAGVRLVQRAPSAATPGLPPIPGLHPTRGAWLVTLAGNAEQRVEPGSDHEGVVPAGAIGTVGEIDPAVALAFGVQGRVGWLEVDLGRLLDPAAVPRRSEWTRPVSRFPTSDVDLAFVVADEVPADEVRGLLEEAGGERLESLTLFDVYRGPAVGTGKRSLAFRLRFGALDHTLSDAELAELRQRCIDTVRQRIGATLR